MAKNKTEAIITLNGQQPLQVLKQLQEAAEGIAKQIDEAQEKLKTLKPNTEPFKELTAQVKDLKKQYDLLSSAQVKDIDAVDRLKSAVDNLSSTSLKNLRKALGEGKRSLEGLSEAELDQANAIRSMMKTVGDQIRLLEGQYVKIRQGLASIGTQSDQWLSKAIRQQQELMVNTRRGTKEYKEQEQVMQMLTAEQNKRNAAISAEANAKRQALFKQQVASSRQMLSSTDTMKGHSQTEIQTAINTLKQAQGQSNIGGSEWKQYADEIAKAEERLASLAGKVKEVKQVMSEKDAKDTITFMDSHTEGEVREAINTLRLLQSQTHIGSEEWKKYAISIADAEESLAKLTGKAKEVKEGLSLTETNERMKTLGEQSEQSLQDMLRVLQEAKGSMEPFSKEWEDLAAKIDNVKARMSEVANNSPFERNYETAQKMARQDGLLDKQGNLRSPTKNDLEWSKSYLQKELGNTSPLETIKINEIKEALGMLDERLSVFKDNADKSAKSAEKLNEVLGNMKTASLDDLKAASTELNKQLGKLAPSSDAAKQVKQQLQALDKEIKQVEDDVVDVNDVIARSKKGKASIEELKKAYQQLQAELNKINTGDAEFKDKQKALKELKKNIDDVTGAADKQSNSWKTALKNLTAYAGLFQVFNAIKDTVTSAIKKNFEFSGSLTDIRKVSGLAMEDVNKLATELSKIDTRTSIDGLAQLAYQGAKLGMGKYGVDGMKQFVAAADQINVAIGEEMGEEALPALSKMVETMGLIPKMGIEKAMLATGSAMFKLASTSTATSGNIVEFAKRLTGVSRTAGITTDQLLALGSASDSLFLMPEVSATAMSKFIVALQKNHNLIEKDLGIQQGTIKNMYAAGNAMDAIVLVLEKMRNKGNMNALGEIFKDLGSDGQRLVTAMVTMSKNVDVLKDHLYESQEAFEEATAVTGEYEMQQKSAVGILERANNLWEKAFVSPEGVDSVKAMAQAWYDMSEMILQSPIFKGTLQGALTMVITSCKILVTLLPLIMNYLVGLGIWKAAAFMWDFGKAIFAAAKAQAGFNAVTRLNPYVALASVLVTVAGVFYSYANAASEAAAAEAEAKRKADEWKNKLGEAEKQTDDLTRKLHSYKVALEAVNLSQKDRNTQIARFNKDFRQYINKLGIEIKSVDDLRKHYSALSLEIQRATYYRLREEAKQDALPGYQKDRLAAANMVKNYISENDSKYGGFTVKDIIRWFQKGADANAAYSYLIKGFLKNTYVNGKLGGANKDIKFNFKTGEYFYDRKNKSGASRGSDYELLSRLRYLYNATNREQNKENEINDYFSPFVPEDYVPWVEDTPGTLENNAKDKDAISAEKQAHREQIRSWREELKQKQDEANAIMDNVRNFYERQINEKLSQAVSLGMDKSEQDLFVEPVKKRMNEALSQVRLAIAGQANAWEDFKKTMDDDLIEKTDETGINLSQNLLTSITQNNIEALRAKMAQLGNSLNRPMNSIMAEIFAKATKNQQENVKLEAQQAEARRKVAQENNFMGAVQQNMYDDFNQMGYANPNSSETVDKEAFDKRKANIIAMYEQARKQIASLYFVDVNEKQDRGLLMQMLFGNDPDGLGARIQSVLGDNADDWRVFYNKLIQYSDEYTEAQKKTYDQAKKIAEQMWKTNQRNLANQEALRKMQQESSLFGKRTNLLSNLGLADLTADPEVELMKLKMQMAEDYYAFCLKNSRNKQLIDEADKTRQEAELAYANQMATAMKNRLSQMQQLVQPIETFGAEVGKAFAEMRNDVSSAQESIKNALKSMLESWVQMGLNDVNTQMWKAINDAGAKQGKKNAQPGIDAARANADANAAIDMDWRNLGTAENPMWVRIVGGQYVDVNGHPLSEGEPPAAWKKRHPNGTIHDYNKEAYGIDTANQAGAAAANAITGNGSLAESVAGIGGSLVGDLLNTNFQTGGEKIDKTDDKARAKQLKNEKKHQKEMARLAKQGMKERKNINKQGTDAIVKTSDEGNSDMTRADQIKNKTLVDAGTSLMNTQISLKKKGNDEQLQSDADLTQAQTTFSIVGAIGKCFAFLGPIAGPIAAAVVMATLNGLLQWALGSAFSSGKKKSSTSSTNTKLVSGMLTYDSGNVQDLKPFVADNGEVYWAKEDDGKQMQGVKMLTSPTATTVNGQPSLVAERGPEIVIGRETTHAMMMNNPGLLKALVNYDRNYSGRNSARRAFDNGNVGDVLAAGMQADNGNPSSGASATGDLIAASAASNAALLHAVNALIQRLNEPINVKINMYGRDGLRDSLNKANQFMKHK